ncbi:MAG: alpha/beta hydrolase family protein, partial [Phycisphaerales bacterium]
RREGMRGVGGLDFSVWANRPRDVSFIIDELDAIESHIPEIKDRVDHERIGVGGHSYGAFTAQLIGGTDPLGPGDFADPRAACVLLISPQGVGGLLTESSWDSFVGPALTISGDNDEGRNGEPAIWRREGFDRSPDDTHTLMWIEDAYHNFGGISGRVLPGPDQGPENPEHVRYVQRASRAFWDHHLRDHPGDVDAFAATLRASFKGEPVEIENN